MSNKRRKKRRHGSSSSAGKSVASFIFSFLLAVVLTLLGLLAVVKVGISESFVTQTFDAGYAAYLQSAAEDGAADYTLPTSIDPEVVKDLFSEDKVLQDSRKLLHAVFAGEEFTPDTTSERDELTHRVENFFESSGLELNDNNREIIDTYVDEIMEMYGSYLEITGLSSFMSVRNLFNRYIWIGIIVLLILAILLTILCVKSHHFAHRGLRYVAYATGGAMLMTLIGPLVMYLSRFYERLMISPQYLHYYLTQYISHVLELCLFAAAIWLLLTFVIISIVGIKRHKLIRGR